MTLLDFILKLMTSNKNVMTEYEVSRHDIMVTSINPNCLYIKAKNNGDFVFQTI
jgi:hypothetical protein